ncbi:MAG: hypothetical protein V3S42_04240 [Candidatus Neomarinimicrobiota bacterium]
MSDYIKSEIKALKQDYPRISGLKQEYLFSLVCLRYFFNDGRFEYSTYQDSFVDGRDDGGIDLITTNEIESQDLVVLIQSKMITSISDSQDLINVFTKMHQTVEDFKNSAKY